MHLEAKAWGERTWDPAYPPGLPQTAELLVKFVSLPYDLGRESTLRPRVPLHSILGPTESPVEDVVSACLVLAKSYGKGWAVPEPGGDQDQTAL